jgi:hypothetical protein
MEADGSTIAEPFAATTIQPRLKAKGLAFEQTITGSMVEATTSAPKLKARGLTLTVPPAVSVSLPAEARVVRVGP